MTKYTYARELMEYANYARQLYWDDFCASALILAELYDKNVLDVNKDLQKAAHILDNAGAGTGDAKRTTMISS